MFPLFTRMNIPSTQMNKPIHKRDLSTFLLCKSKPHLAARLSTRHTYAKVSPHTNAALAGAAFISFSALGNPSQEPTTDGGHMVPRAGVTVDICPRDLPIALIGTAGGALALWASAPAEIVIPTALLIVLDVRIRRWRRRT
jgi:hypothetical protein